MVFKWKVGFGRDGRRFGRLGVTVSVGLPPLHPLSVTYHFLNLHAGWRYFDYDWLDSVLRIAYYNNLFIILFNL